MAALRFPVLLATLLLLVGCQPSDTTQQPQFSTTLTILTGYHFYNPEQGHVLFALGLDGPICIQDGRDLNEAIEGRLAELRGYLSVRGDYGTAHCPYAFRVAEVVEDRELTPGDRQVLAPLFRVVAEPPPGEEPGAHFQQSHELDQSIRRPVII